MRPPRGTKISMASRVYATTFEALGVACLAMFVPRIGYLIGRGGRGELTGLGALIGRGAIMGPGGLIGRGPLKGDRGGTSRSGLKKGMAAFGAPRSSRAAGSGGAPLHRLAFKAALGPLSSVLL